MLAAQDAIHYLQTVLLAVTDGHMVKWAWVELAPRNWSLADAEWPCAQSHCPTRIGSGLRPLCWSVSVPD